LLTDSSDEFDLRNNNISSSPLLRQTTSLSTLQFQYFFGSSRKTYSRSLQYDESTIYRSSQAKFSRSHMIENILFDRHSDVHLKDQILCYYCDWYPINYLSTVIDQYCRPESDFLTTIELLSDDLDRLYVLCLSCLSTYD